MEVSITKMDATKVKVIEIELNGETVHLKIMMINDIPSVSILKEYSQYCYELNACDNCNEDHSGKNCLFR